MWNDKKDEPGNVGDLEAAGYCNMPYPFSRSNTRNASTPRLGCRCVIHFGAFQLTVCIFRLSSLIFYFPSSINILLPTQHLPTHRIHSYI